MRTGSSRTLPMTTMRPSGAEAWAFSFSWYICGKKIWISTDLTRIERKTKFEIAVALLIPARLLRYLPNLQSKDGLPLTKWP